MNPFLEKFRVYLLIFFAFLFYPIFIGLVFLRAKDKEGKKLKILIIPQLTRIGDLVCATPVFREIKNKYPESFLAAAVTPKIAGIIKNNPRIDEIIILEDKEYLRFFGPLKFFRKIREKNFDWAFCVSASVIGTLISFYGLIHNRAKIVRQQRTFSEILTDWLNDYQLNYKGEGNLPRFYLRILKFIPLEVVNQRLTPKCQKHFGLLTGFIGIDEPEEVRKEVFTSRAGDEKAERFLRERNISPNDLVIGIGMTAGNKIKEWPEERFRELAKRLIEKHNAKIVFINPKDFSLEEFPSLMKKFKLFISADCGPIHIAHALGVPLIDIIGPVDPSEQAPQCENCIIVKPPASVKPTIFAMKPAGDPAESRRAVESISVEKVFNSTAELLTKISKNATY